MVAIINDDLSLNKDAFKQIIKEVDESLKKLLVPTGRNFINFNYPEGKAPSFEEHSSEIDSSDMPFPSLNLIMKADYRINYIPSLFDEWYESHSVKLSRLSQSLKDQPSATRFCVLASKEVDKKLNALNSFKKNKWMVNSVVSLDFANAETDNAHEYTDFLKLTLAISITQG